MRYRCSKKVLNLSSFCTLIGVSCGNIWMIFYSMLFRVFSRSKVSITCLTSDWTLSYSNSFISWDSVSICGWQGCIACYWSPRIELIVYFLLYALVLRNLFFYFIPLSCWFFSFAASYFCPWHDDM